MPEGKPPTSFGRKAPGFAERLIRSIHAGGPISLANYMAQANSHYYATRNPLGAEGDFITAPEISQMFGELIGLCLADIWHRTGRAGAPYYVELGPGRGTLAKDALRAMEQARVAPKAHLVETSPALRAHQSAAVAHAKFHDDVESLPTDAPLLIVANEFFDALPIAQAVKAADGSWRELMVGLGAEGRGLAPVIGERRVDARVPEALRDAPAGAIHESCPVGATIMLTLARRIARQGGAMIAIDYGYEGPALGDTLQAVRAHKYADPYADPGENDLTAHVDFTLLGNAARQEGLRVHTVVGQGEFLERLGLGARARTLCVTTPDRAQEIEQARRRLAAPDQMGRLFRVLGVTHPDWPTPEGFA
mgnify:CR=1 FL=1